VRQVADEGGGLVTLCLLLLHDTHHLAQVGAHPLQRKVRPRENSKWTLLGPGLLLAADGTFLSRRGMNEINLVHDIVARAATLSGSPPGGITSRSQRKKLGVGARRLGSWIAALCRSTCYFGSVPNHKK